MSTPATKAGARHSASDQQHVQSIHDSAASLGATCEPDSAAVKAIVGDPAMYAARECNDVMGGANALQNIAMLIASELGEGDESDDAQVASLVSAARTLLDFLSGEVDEIDGYTAADVTEDAGEDSADDTGDLANIPVPDVIDPSYKIAAREDVNPKRGTAEYGAVTFADAKNKKYPLDTEAHIRSAWSYFGMPKNAGKYSSADQATIRSRIIAAWKKKIDKDGPPSAATKSGFEVKALGDDRIGGWAVRFGSADEPDLSADRDYFTPATKFWLDQIGPNRPMLYHHAMEEATADDPVIGTWVKAEAKPEGIWLEGELSKAHRYHNAIKELAARGYLRISSDSAPHLVRRAKQENGTNEIKQWPLLAASLTVSAAEPRLLPVEIKGLLSEIGYEESAPAADERARKLALELELLALE